MVIEIIDQSHEKYGKYRQFIYDTVIDAGHKQLPSKGEFGWGMPDDHHSREIVQLAKGRKVFELGVGLGDTVVLPSLLNGAELYVATDVTSENLEADSWLVVNSRKKNVADRLVTYQINSKWWSRELDQDLQVGEMLGIGSEIDRLSFDIMVARHSVQFGSPQKFMNVLDLAMRVLRPEGVFMAINFTPYTGYMFNFDTGQTMRRIADLNKEYMNGDVLLPGGYLSSESEVKVSLAKLMGKPELDRDKENSFLYFDQATIVGLLDRWNETRVERGLSQSLVLAESYYYSPEQIAKVNKYPNTDTFQNRENHAFVIKKNGD